MQKLTRIALGFVEPKPGVNLEEFSHCVSCRKLVPQKYLGRGFKGSRCITLGSKVELKPYWSCNEYEAWDTPKGRPEEHVVKNHAAELVKGMRGDLTPETAGLVKHKVQCHRCAFERNGVTQCHLFYETQRANPKVWDMDTRIGKHTCCNAQTPKDGEKLHQHVTYSTAE